VIVKTALLDTVTVPEPLFPIRKRFVERASVVVPPARFHSAVPLAELSASPPMPAAVENELFPESTSTVAVVPLPGTI
jgi:hypothetical protein